MKTQISTFILVLLTGLSFSAHAKVWRINNNAGVNADFTSANAAVISTTVQSGDTLYFEASATDYGGITISKKLVLIGTGYFLDSTNNPGLQYNPNAAVINGVVLDSAGTGSTFTGLTLNFLIGPGAGGSSVDNLTITRCRVTGIGNYYGYTPGTILSGWKVNKNYITGSFGDGAWVMQNWDVSNNIIDTWINMENTACSGNVIRNNVFRGAIHIVNGYFANNLLSGWNDYVFTNTVVKNTLSVGTPSTFTAYVGSNNNSYGYTDAQLFAGTGSTDGKWKLAATSPAKQAGLTVGSVVKPDCGAFGGPDPYILSGIPNIPAIYKLTVPASIASGTSSMNITFSTRSNP